MIVDFKDSIGSWMFEDNINKDNWNFQVTQLFSIYI